MKKIVAPTILILVLASVVCLLVAKEYSKSKRAQNPVINKIEDMKNDTSNKQEEGPVISEKRLTAEDVCLVISKDIEESTITFRNIRGGEDKVINYDRKTKFLTRHNGPLTAAEIMPGDIVDISFTTFDSRLVQLKMSEKAWENKNVSRFEIDEKGKTIIIGDELYKMASNSVIASGDKLGKILDVTGQDTITVRGIDKDVYSIQIERGHGYIRVTNDSYFVGGWIEIGQDIITILTESMLIPVPEGTYDVKVTNKGYVGRENIEIVRDKETKLDLSKVEIEEVAIGHVLFDITPDYAQLFVDGIMTDFEERVPLEYGIHSIRVELAGYETVHANIRVGSENANISVELDEEAEEDSPSPTQKPLPEGGATASALPTITPADTQNSATSSSFESIISDNKKIYIDGPQGCEVYLDGTYIGVAPCNTQKVTGNHTITLSKSGCETKSYTISVGNDGKDLTLSFSELSAINQ